MALLTASPWRRLPLVLLRLLLQLLPHPLLLRLLRLPLLLPRLLQALLVLIKKVPPTEGRKLMVVATTSQRNAMEELGLMDVRVGWRGDA